VRRHQVRIRDTHRLERRYQEFLDWAEVIAWYVHHPWLEEPPTSVVVAPGDLANCATPAALRLSVAAFDRRDLEHLVAVMRDRLFCQGWLTSTYRGDSIWLQADLRISDQRNLDQLDTDTSSDTSSARHTWLDAVRRFTHRRLGESTMTSEVLTFLRSRTLDELRGAQAVGASFGPIHQRPLLGAIHVNHAAHSDPAVITRIHEQLVSVHSSGVTPRAGIGVVTEDGGVLTTAATTHDAIEILVRDQALNESPAHQVGEVVTGDLVILQVDAPPVTSVDDDSSLPLDTQPTTAEPDVLEDEHPGDDDVAQVFPDEHAGNDDVEQLDDATAPDAITPPTLYAAAGASTTGSDISSNHVSETSADTTSADEIDAFEERSDDMSAPLLPPLVATTSNNGGAGDDHPHLEEASSSFRDVPLVRSEYVANGATDITVPESSPAMRNPVPQNPLVIEIEDADSESASPPPSDGGAAPQPVSPPSPFDAHIISTEPPRNHHEDGPNHSAREEIGQSALDDLVLHDSFDSGESISTATSDASTGPLE
jgi:hypothetical protein